MEIYNWFRQNKKYFFIGLSILIVSVLFFFFTRQSSTEPLAEIKEPKAPVIKSQPEETKKDPKQKSVMIDVKGAVVKPGVYELPADKRIKDAVKKAGGFTSEADLSAINQAEKLKDEMAVYVAKVGEAAKGQMGSHNKASASGSKVKLNQATAEDLEKVPGIGAAKAKTIISYREKEGFFQTIEDLKKVSGIGAKTVDKLKEHLEI